MQRERTHAERAGRRPRYRDIREELRREIQSKRYSPGERLPSDSELAARFSVSRLTIIRSLRELEAESLVRRRAGSGTFVVGESDNAPETEALVFGLLMPDLGDGEVFEPVARGIALAGETLHHRLLWGSHSAGQNKEAQAEELCRYLISRKVAGVFFAPIEHTAHQEEVNERIASALDAAGIPIVLVDRCFRRYPDRSRYDLVGIDNRRAGYRIARHLIDHGAKRLVFAASPGAASTVAARQSGCREAVWDAGLDVHEPLVIQVVGEAGQERSSMLKKFLRSVRPDGIVCANDFTAATLMHDLLKLGVRIPEEIRMIGINDVKYASFLPVPLTTLRQPCQLLGAEAMSIMLDRLKRPTAPARDVLLGCELIVRQSCGA